MSPTSPQHVPAFWETPGASRCSPPDLFRTFKSSEEALSCLAPAVAAAEQDPLRPYTDMLPHDSFVFVDTCSSGMRPESGYSRASWESLDSGTMHEYEQEHDARSASVDLHQLLSTGLDDLAADTYSYAYSDPRLPLKRNWSAEDVHHRAYKYGGKHSARRNASPPGSAPGPSAACSSVRAKGQLKYTCHECGKTFQRPSSLATHINIHTGDKPFVCPVLDCGRQFNARSNMVRHYKLHFRTIHGNYLLPSGELSDTVPALKQ
ncbi:LANO_0F13190g1_1 [Lachancea nothofagi CBS 11611]|uniref:LANO_0F13190g1_1 n=1 Tax=Lachancea nothofagi CBS 11611 TaxID=1266666 RepID=A0A1G4KBR0_9SACH|nr:LANO_0F13190g1_1 [Lachancea nothofagi CBS 11611]